MAGYNRFFLPLWLAAMAVASQGAAPAVWHKVLPCGAEVAVERNTASRVFAVHVLVKNRSADEPSGKTGITDLVHRMLEEGKGVPGGAGWRQEFDTIGAQLKTVDDPSIPFDDYYTVPEFSFVRFQTIDTFYEKGLSLLRRVLYDPDLSEANLARARKGLEQARPRYDRSPSSNGRRALDGLLFSDSWKALSVYGTPETVAAITLRDIVDYHRRHFRPANLVVTVQTNLPESVAAKRVEALFAGFPGEPPTLRADARPASGAPQAEPKRLALGGMQSYVAAGDVFPIDQKDVPAWEVMTVMLSDAVSFELRERQGLAYTIGASTDVSGGGPSAVLAVSMGTRKENIEKARAGILDQVGLFCKAAQTQRELQTAVNRALGRSLMRWIPSLSRAYYMGVSLFKGLPPQDFRERVMRWKTVSGTDVSRVREAYLHPDRFRWVVVE